MEMRSLAIEFLVGGTWWMCLEDGQEFKQGRRTVPLLKFGVGDVVKSEW